MKRLLRLGGVLLFLSITGLSCDNLGDCKTCKLVVYENGTKVSETTGTPYCGEKLAEKEDADPVVVGNSTSVWECE